MVLIKLLTREVPKSLIVRHNMENETDVPEERAVSTSFLKLSSKIPGFDNHWRQTTVLDGPIA